MAVAKKKTTKSKKTAKSLPSEVAVTTDSGTAADLNNVVLRMERELDGVEWNRDAGIGGIDVVPEAADDMGPGIYISMMCQNGGFAISTQDIR